MMLNKILFQCYWVGITFSPHRNNLREKHLNYPIKLKIPYVLKTSTSTETECHPQTANATKQGSNGIPQN